ncbi:MAG: ABC transporter permease, partial [Novosphingobium sp.]|nr:ABC transporter permease [Novosphingobium sp.]
GRSRALVRTLLIYPAVRRWHAMAATSAVELFNAFAIVAIVMGANWLIFGNGELAHPAAYVWGIVLSWLLGSSYGFVFTVLAEIRQIWWLIGQSLLRPSFFISAVFFTGNELPERLVRLLDWNPLLHAVEITRSAMLIHYDSRIASENYVLACIAGLFLMGLAIRQFVRG